MATITIDARLYGTEHTGLGRYTQNVLAHLPQYLPKHKLQILLRRHYYESLTFPKNCQKILCDIPHYSLAEQLWLPLKLRQLHSDLLYTFHFNLPLLTPLPTIVTVHDLIKSYFTSADTTTRSPWVYQLKRYGYNQVIKKTLTHALDIIVPTNTVKNQILSNFSTVKPEHLHPIPEAPDPIFRQPSPQSKSLSFELPANYLLFVGNAYPHKNLKVLLEAFRDLKDPNLHLVIVSKHTPFLSRTLAPYEPRQIKLLQELSDVELSTVYSRARALVTPSLMEGYGLIGLEALMVGTPVIASNIPVYREVYGDKVTYFDPHSSATLVSAIRATLPLARPKPLSFARTWDDVAQTIAEVIHARCSGL